MLMPGFLEGIQFDGFLQQRIGCAGGIGRDIESTLPSV
jgi:hypothetical protein